MSLDPLPPPITWAERKTFIDDEFQHPPDSRLDRLFAATRIDRAHIKPLAALLLVATAVSIWLFWHSRARETLVADPRPTVSEQLVIDSPSPQGSEAPSTVVVDVGGRVKHPGVYKLPPGSRAIDALAAAGGALPGTDLTLINQAQLLEDGEQLVVGTDRGGSSTGAQPRPGKVNLNSASTQELDALPGIGPVLAARIVAWRKANGRFKSVEDLRQVSGVGDAKFADLRPLVRI